MKSCFFIGHRDASEALYPLIVREVERHIVEYGVSEFIVGQYGRFDGMAARAVREMKGRFPGIRLVLLQAYLKNKALPEGYDASVYPEGLEYVPKRFAILRANRAMVDRCDYLIACVSRNYGGAWQCLEYAKRKRKRIVNLGATMRHGDRFRDSLLSESESRDLSP